MDKNIGSIAMTMLDVLNQLKIYHWQTKSYARHKASCKLISSLTDITDKIIETLQGKKNTRLNIVQKTNTIILSNQNDMDIIDLLNEFKNYLVIVFPRYLTSKDTDILNLRDELLGEVNKTLYLFSLN
jgi:hypothetical protein